MAFGIGQATRFGLSSPAPCGPLIQTLIMPETGEMASGNGQGHKGLGYKVWSQSVVRPLVGRLSKL
ncbi:MAG: hypothetical protein DWQ05_12745 [Calditrichaeota bacterium]|nr:MAG: hypothetical protein DWQ05_12745 [Calditrichota bacterium]